jgi:hypothetical protein
MVAEFLKNAYIFRIPRLPSRTSDPKICRIGGHARAGTKKLTVRFLRRVKRLGQWQV